MNICSRCSQPHTSPKIKEGMCFSCLYWSSVVDKLNDPDENNDNHEIIIANGRVFIPVPGFTGPDRLRGFNGRVFTFKMNDGTTIVSNNVWNGSVIPTQFREELPDNAELLETADHACHVCGATKGRMRAWYPGHHYCDKHYDEVSHQPTVLKSKS